MKPGEQRKKLLIITYYWPPAGGITVLRCLKLAKYIRKFGWEPIIYTVSNPSYQFTDASNDKDIPENIQILKGKILDPTEIFKRISGRKKSEALVNITNITDRRNSIIDKIGIWIRGNFFIPDARRLWIKPSVKYLSEYLQEHPVDAIFTDGPPHTNTVIGLRLAARFNIPWLADFQDPWTQVDYYKQMMVGKRAHRIHSRLEQEVFKTADKITIASPTWKKELESIGAKDVSVFYYGFDEEEFKTYAKKENPVFKIFHGGLLGDDRNPEILFEVISDIIREDPSRKKRISIELAGQIDHKVKNSISYYALDENTKYLGQLTRLQVFKNYEDSALLLLPINKADNAAGRMPGKLYEYLRAQTSILVFGPENGDVKNIVESKQLGRSFPYDVEKSILKEYILYLLRQHDNNKITALNVDVSEFSNEEQTRKIAQYLDDITR